MTKQQCDNIGKLIKKVSSRTPTEDLIAFVAANFGMLPACQKILDLLGAPDSAEKTWLDEQCHNYHINSQILQKESERVLAIFQPGLSNDEQYRLLGLTPIATIGEVKSAFRKLSFRYHPDSSATQDPADSKKFIAICRAYKKIMRAHETQISTLNQADNTPWHHDSESQQPPRQKHKTILLIAAIACILFFISLSATRSYRKKAMLKSLGRTPQVVATTIQSKPQKLPEQNKVTKSTPAPQTPTLDPRPKPIKVAATTSQPQKTKSSKLVVSTRPTVKEKNHNSIPQTPKTIANASQPRKAVQPESIKLPEQNKAAKSTPVPQTITPHPLPEPIKIAAVKRPKNIPVSRTTKPAKPQALPTVIRALPKTKPLLPETLRSTSPSVSLPLAAPAPEIPTVTGSEVATVSTVTPVLVVSPSLPVFPPLRNRIDIFLAAYTNAYELLDFETFFTFFTDEARENGTLLKEKSSQYRQLFGRLKEISYKVTPKFWQAKNNVITIKGRFHAYLLYKNGEEANIHGTTSFVLQEDQKKTLKVKTLTYTFD